MPAVRPGVYQLWKPETEVLRKGVLQPQPLRGGAAIMEKKRFRQEKHCQALLAIADHLLKRQLVTATEHRKITTAILCRYHPSVGWRARSFTVHSKRQKIKIYRKETIKTKKPESETRAALRAHPDGVLLMPPDENEALRLSHNKGGESDVYPKIRH